MKTKITHFHQKYHRLNDDYRASCQNIIQKCFKCLLYTENDIFKTDKKKNIKMKDDSNVVGAKTLLYS